MAQVRLYTSGFPYLVVALLKCLWKPILTHLLAQVKFIFKNLIIEFKDLNSSFICLGGPIPNEMTEWAINEKGNHFLEFSIPDDIEEKPITLNVISNTVKPLSFQEKQGIVLQRNVDEKITQKRKA
jgi:hypothetical protein